MTLTIHFVSLFPRLLRFWKGIVAKQLTLALETVADDDAQFFFGCFA